MQQLLAGDFTALARAGPAFEGTAGRIARRLAPLGSEWPAATSLPDLARRVPSGARWVLDDVSEPSDLWRAEAGWWVRLESDGHDLLRQARPGRGVVVGAVALLAADAWRTTAALQVAARGERAVEAYDALG